MVLLQTALRSTSKILREKKKLNRRKKIKYPWRYFQLDISQILMTYVKRWQTNTSNMFEDTYFNEELFVQIFQVKIVCLNVISIYTNRSLDIFFL